MIEHSLSMREVPGSITGFSKYFLSIDETTLPRLLTTTVRHHLEYGNVIWCPRFRRDKLEVEKIQRRATKLKPNLRSLPCRDRLEALKLPSLCYHKRQGNMLQVYKIPKGIDRLESNQFFSLAEISNTKCCLFIISQT